MEGKRHINYQSDFKLIQPLACTEGEETQDIGFPEYSFKLTYFTASSSNGYVASCIYDKEGNASMRNLKNVDGKILVVFDNHRLMPGDLKVKMIVNLPDADFPDGKQKVVTPAETGINLWTKASDTTETEAVQLIVPYIFRSAYDLAKAHGFTGTEEEYYLSLAKVGEMAEIAGKADEVTKAVEEWENEKDQFIRKDEEEEYSDEEMEEFLNTLN